MTSEKEGRIWADERAEAPMTPPYVPVTPAQLPDWLADDALLVLDVRPAAAHNAARSNHSTQAPPLLPRPPRSYALKLRHPRPLR